jgi:acetylornithine deacetylase
MIHVLRTLRETAVRRRATVIFVGTVDEEFGMRGAAKFVEGNGKADGAIVAEPTDLNTVVASKGILRWQLRVKGRAAHSSKPDLGISAITKMAKVLTAIEERFPAIFAQRYHPLLGSPTITVGVIRGGVQVNQVPDSCLVDIDRRLIPGETQETVWQDFERLIAELRAADRDLNVVMEPPTFANGPLETTTAHRIVQVVCKVSSGLRGPREVVGVPFGSDATALADAGIPCIILGPGSVDQAHAEEEYVDLDQVAAAAEIYAGAALEF